MRTASAPKILIVDDDPDLLDLVSQIICFHDMETDSLSNGSEVLAVLQAGKYDAVLMDIFIGSEDGRELARKIKQDSRCFQTPVLLYSAAVIDEKSVTVCGADGFLKKPFEMSHLVNRLKQLLPQ